MELSLASKILASNSLEDAGSFYGPPGHLSLGVGLFISDATFPIYNWEKAQFTVTKGNAYILSHECDLDPQNDKVLGGYCLICPIIPITNLIRSAVKSDLSQNDISAFLGNLAARRVSRFVYLPPLKNFDHGAVLNLNQITSTSIELLKLENAIAAVSKYGLESIDKGLENHLRRAKSEVLPLVEAPLRRSITIKRSSGPS